MLSVRSFADLPVRAGAGAVEIRHLEPGEEDPASPSGATLRDVRLRPGADHDVVLTPRAAGAIHVVEGTVSLTDPDSDHVTAGETGRFRGAIAVRAGAAGARLLVLALPDPPTAHELRGGPVRGASRDWPGWGALLWTRSAELSVALHARLDPGTERHHHIPLEAAGYLLVVSGEAHVATDVDGRELSAGDGATIPGGVTVSVRARRSTADLLLVVAARIT